MATAKKLPSGSWRVQVYAGKDSEGKIKSKSFTASTKREAEYLALQYQQERKEPAADMTVGQAIDKYIEIKSNNTVYFDLDYFLELPNLPDKEKYQTFIDNLKNHRPTFEGMMYFDNAKYRFLLSFLSTAKA